MSINQNKQAEIRDALADSDLFGSLFDEELDQLVSYGKTTSVPEGNIVFQRGDDGDSLMIVITGRIKISNVSIDGKEAVLNFIEPCNCFGEIAMLDGKKRSADATALVATELFVLRKADMLRFIEAHPDVVWRVMGVLCAKLRRTSEMVEDSVLLTMEPRIARGILRLASDYGRKSPEGIRIEFRMSQRELGSYVGLARENVNRHLGTWRQRGVLSIENGVITIHDQAALEAAAGN